MIEKAVHIIMQMPDSVSEQKNEAQLAEAIDAMVMKLDSISVEYSGEFGCAIGMLGNSGLMQPTYCFAARSY